MKKILLISLLVVLGSGLFAQVSNLVFFSEQGEQFFVVLNGVQQNNDAQTNVKVTDINGNTMKIKIMFSNSAIPAIDKTIYFNPGMETTYSVKQNNKGEYVLRPFSETPVAQAAPPVQNQTVIVYGSPSVPTRTVVAEPVATQTTVTQTTVTQPATGENVSMGVSVSDQMGGANINMNISTGNAVSTSTTTTTTTSSVTIVEEPAYVEPNQANPGHYMMPGYNGPIGCPWPMDPPAFENVKQSIASKTFEDSKLTIAKQVISSNCLLSGQVKEIMLLFTFEETRLELAKFAYGHTFDIGNFFMLNDAFTFESSIDELNQYINGYRW